MNTLAALPPSSPPFCSPSLSPSPSLPLSLPPPPSLPPSLSPSLSLPLSPSLPPPPSLSLPLSLPPSLPPSLSPSLPPSLPPSLSLPLSPSLPPSLSLQGVGEVLVSGRHVFMGYMGNPMATSEVLTSDGWLRSGDLGYLSEVSEGWGIQDPSFPSNKFFSSKFSRKHEKSSACRLTTGFHLLILCPCPMQEGYLYITGRMKELIITASGEKVPPRPIEEAIKRELPLISNAIVIGDQQRFLCCLVTLKVRF